MGSQRLKFLARKSKEFRNLRKWIICYYARLPRSKLRGLRVQSFSSTYFLTRSGRGRMDIGVGMEAKGMAGILQFAGQRANP
jgi:hypothetical protein